LELQRREEHKEDKIRSQEVHVGSESEKNENIRKVVVQMDNQGTNMMTPGIF